MRKTMATYRHSVSIRRIVALPAETKSIQVFCLIPPRGHMPDSGEISSLFNKEDLAYMKVSHTGMNDACMLPCHAIPAPGFTWAWGAAVAATHFLPGQGGVSGVVQYFPWIPQTAQGNTQRVLAPSPPLSRWGLGSTEAAAHCTHSPEQSVSFKKGGDPPLNGHLQWGIRNDNLFMPSLWSYSRKKALYINKGNQRRILSSKSQTMCRFVKRRKQECNWKCHMHWHDI